MPKPRKQNVTRLEPDNISRSGMAPVAIETLLLGLDLGWDATEMRNGQIRLSREHEGRAVAIMLPTNQRSIKESVGRSWIRKVVRYADPVRRALLVDMIENWNSHDQHKRESAQVIMRGLRSSEVMTDPEGIAKFMTREPEPEPELAPVPEPEPEVEQEQEQPEPAPDEPHVTKIKPWVARHTMRREGGEVYESKAVLERKWSDGSTDYQCSRCDWSNAEPRRVAAHYGGKHGQDFPAQDAQREGWVDPAVQWVPTERQRGRISRLANEMKQALEAIGPEMTVEQCAEWIVKHRDEAREHLMDESTELTAEQVIERVRRLVDHGAYADLMARIEAVEAEAVAAKAQAEAERQHERLGAQNALSILEARVAEFEQQVQDAEERVAAAQREAQEANERWTALRDLVNG